MKWKLKPEVAAVLSESDRHEVTAAINHLTQANLTGQSNAYTAVLTLQSNLFDLVPEPPEPANTEPL